MPANIGLGNHIENKNELISHNFDIFSQGSVEKAMEKGYEQEIHLSSALNNDGPFEFIIPPSNEYILLPQTRLYIKGKITTPNGGTPANDTEFSVVNLFPHALFRQVDVHIGGVNTSSQDMLYPYKAYFETLFSYSSAGKKSHLCALSAYEEDTPGKFDNLDEENSGYDGRKIHVFRGRTFDFCIPLHADIMQCSRLIPPNTPMKIYMTRMPDAFALMCAENTDLQIRLSHMSLFIRKIIPTDHIKNLYNGSLSKKCNPSFFKEYY